MKNFIKIICLSLLISSCVSIPKETVELSQTLGNDLKVLQTSHRNAVSIYYQKIKDNIDIFIKDTYTPFIINHVLKQQLDAYKNGSASIFKYLNDAAQNNSPSTTEKAVNGMRSFLKAADKRIKMKRDELMNPIVTQEASILSKIDQSYQNAMYANSTVTAYLKSIRKVKETQQEALSLIGLKNLDSTITTKLSELSDNIKIAIQKGKEIDVKSDDAIKKIKEITDQIKKLTNKQ